MMVLPQPAPTLFAHQNTTNISSSGSSMTCFHFPPQSCIPLPKDDPIIPSLTIRTCPSSPPGTPEASHSALTSPVSSVLPQIPPDAHSPAFCKVVLADSSLIRAPVIPHSHRSGPILVAWLDTHYLVATSLQLYATHRIPQP